MAETEEEPLWKQEAKVVALAVGSAALAAALLYSSHRTERKKKLEALINSGSRSCDSS